MPVAKDGRSRRPRCAVPLAGAGWLPVKVTSTWARSRHRPSKRLQSFIAESEFQLVETLAERIAGIVTGEFDVPWVRVRVNKPGAIRGARDVGVIIERGERPQPD